MALRLALGLVVFWTTVRVWGQAPRAETEPDPLLAASGADPLALARVVDELGDDVVLLRLSPKQSVEVRLASLRAAPWMREPELALETLADILRTRDSVLAPAAARAVFRIAARLDARALAVREVMPAELTTARAALTRAAGDDSLRADIRLYAGQAADALAACGVPKP